MKKRYTEEQIIGFLREADAGIPIVELCRRHGFSEASFYLWRNKFGGMSVSDAKRLKELEGENTRLKRALANAMLENEVIKVSIHQIGKQRGAQVALAEGWNDDHNQLASVFRSFGNFHCSPERGT